MEAVVANLKQILTVKLLNTYINEEIRAPDNIIRVSKEHLYQPPNEAATATEPATNPAAAAIAANPLAPMKGTSVPSVGARAPNPAAMAGAAKPVGSKRTRAYESPGVVCPSDAKMLSISLDILSGMQSYPQ
jgi:hypothetical protein